MEIDDQQFGELVDEVWNELPQEFKDQIENTQIVIIDQPNPEQLQRMQVKGLLLGLFEGVPKTTWGAGLVSILPSKITIFRKPILQISKNLKDLKITIHVVVMHEIAHYFGYNDNDMFILDKKMRTRLNKEIE